eukprot:SAG31_NODE_1656_length_7621_cov_3.193433_5_plen_87_part_00
MVVMDGRPGNSRLRVAVEAHPEGLWYCPRFDMVNISGHYFVLLHVAVLANGPSFLLQQLEEIFRAHEWADVLEISFPLLHPPTILI